VLEGFSIPESINFDRSILQHSSVASCADKIRSKSDCQSTEHRQKEKEKISNQRFAMAGES
jgi:hypothetical protein